MAQAGLFGLTARASGHPVRAESPGREPAHGWDIRVGPHPPDVFEEPDRMVAVLGVLREPRGGPLGAAELVRTGIVHDDGIRADRLTGCGLVVSVDRRRPVIHAYRTLLGLPQLYFHATAGALHLSTSLREILTRTGPMEPDEVALVEHFTLRFALPPRTCWRGISQLPGGHLLTWRNGRTEHHRVTRLSAARSERFTRVTPNSVEWLDAEMVRVTAHHALAARRAGREPTTLLSGGVDSVLLELWLGDAVRDRVGGDRRSCAFGVPDAPSFAAETARADAAAARLGTEHLFATVSAAEYPGLLDRAVETLARPSLFNEAWPCHLALADAVRERWGAEVTLFGGNAADGLHGVPDLPVLSPRAASLLGRDAEASADLAAAGRVDESDPLRASTSLVSLAAELPLLLECFGPDAVRAVFDRRRELARDAAPSEHPWERLQMVDLLTTGCEPSSAVADLHGESGIDVAMIYRDDEVAAAVASFAPDVRFLCDAGDGRVRLKPLQHAMLLARGQGELASVPKGGTTFWQDLWGWMGATDGPLWERVMSMERPDFMSRKLFERVRGEPSDLLWNLLAHDTWRRLVPPASEKP